MGVRYSELLPYHSATSCPRHIAAGRGEGNSMSVTAEPAEMDQNFALRKTDLDAGYILTCQAHPTSSTVTVDYDG
jgi:hypothetical protein